MVVIPTFLLFDSVSEDNVAVVYGRDARLSNPIVQLLAIVQTINTTKLGPNLSDTLAACNSPAAEVTSHTLFEEGDVMNVLEEFWYGNLDPAEYDSCTTKEYKELL